MDDLMKASQGLDDLNHIVNWLHSAGLYQAENALMREVELKFPEGNASTGHRSSSNGGGGEDHLSLTPSPRSPPPKPAGGATIDLCPSLPLNPPAPIDASLNSAEK